MSPTEGLDVDRFVELLTSIEDVEPDAAHPGSDHTKDVVLD